jgi:hypothetical protein
MVRRNNFSVKIKKIDNIETSALLSNLIGDFRSFRKEGWLSIGATEVLAKSEKSFTWVTNNYKYLIFSEDMESIQAGDRQFS